MARRARWISMSLPHRCRRSVTCTLRPRKAARRSASVAPGGAGCSASNGPPARSCSQGDAVYEARHPSCGGYDL
jgi:hypothetical protein